MTGSQIRFENAPTTEAAIYLEDNYAFFQIAQNVDNFSEFLVEVSLQRVIPRAFLKKGINSKQMDQRIRELKGYSQ